MSILKKSKSHNYMAKIVKLGDSITHPNADKLLGWEIDYQTVYTDLSYKSGDVVVFFPAGCKINTGILRYLNLFSDSSLNVDTTKKGYFEKTGRVKAVKLRGEPSYGVILHIEDVENAIEFITEKTVIFSMQSSFEDVLNVEFDMYQDFVICEKYNPIQLTGSTANLGKSKQVKQTDDIIGFEFHYDTSAFLKNLHKFNPDDDIVITYKIHGTSAIIGNLYKSVRLNFVKRLIDKYIAPISKYQTTFIASSRRRIVGISSKSVQSDESVYRRFASHFEKALSDNPGYTIYYEIAGLIDGKCVQKNYDYSKALGNLFVYRITHTNERGIVTELSWDMIKKFCNKYGLTYVPELFVGTFNNYLKKRSNETLDTYKQRLVQKLTDDYTNKNCHLCTNPVPEEGVCIRVRDINYKLKSFRFLELESLNNEPDVEY